MKSTAPSISLIARMLYCIAGMPIVFLISEDWMLRTGLRAELREAGIEAMGFENANDALSAMNGEIVPTLVVLDSTSAQDPALTQFSRSIPRLLVAPRTEPAPHSDASTTVVFRPVSIGDLTARVKQLLQGCPA